MRAVFRALLNRTYEVERRSRVPDGQGGWVIVWADVGQIRGRMRPATSNERMVADSEEQQITHVLYCIEGEDIVRGDLVTLDDLTVEVLGIREPSQMRHHWEIDCLERQQEVAA